MCIRDSTNTFIEIENDNFKKFDFMHEWIAKLNLRKQLNKNDKKVKFSNPKIIPRNHILENVLNECKNGNYKNLSRFISILKNPYSSDIPEEFIKEPTNEEKVYETFCGT